MMRATLLTLAAGSLVLTGCDAMTAKPIELPKDMAEAAKTCFTVEVLSARIEDGRTETDPIRLSEYSKAVQYSMIAASKAEDFGIETVLKMLPDAKSVAEDLKSIDFKGTTAACKKRFAIGTDATAPTLPEKDLDAGMACYSMSQFFRGGIEGEEVDSEGKAEYYAALNKRLETTLDAQLNADPAVAAQFDDPAKAEEMIVAGLKAAFSKGDPVAYLAVCDKRFPAS